MKQVWSDVPQVYETTLLASVKGGKVLHTHRPMHVSDGRENPQGVDSYTRRNRRGLVKSDRSRGMPLKGNESREGLLRLLHGNE